MLLCEVSFATKHENRTNYRGIDTNFEVISHTVVEQIYIIKVIPPQ